MTSNPPHAKDRDSETDVLIDPTNLAVITKHPLRPVGNNLVFNVSGAPPVALAVNWPTATGYSLLILDNMGKGFASPGTINFTFQAAKDSRKRLDDALAARPDYRRSNQFQLLYDSADKHLQAGNASTDERVNGSEGALALDDLTRATDLLLSEYGIQYAKAHAAVAPPWIGVTIDDIGHYQRSLDVAKKITEPYTWIRIVFDPESKIGDYDDVVAAAKRVGLKVLGLPIDSHAAAKYVTTQDYVERVRAVVGHFPEVDAWEVGNEVNGKWLITAPSQVPSGKAFGPVSEKINASARLVRQMRPGAMSVLTLYWQLGTDEPQWSTFNWARANLLASTRDSINVVLLSTWVDDAPMGLAFDRVMRELRAEFPGKQIGLGELGYWNKDTSKAWWAYDTNVDKARKRIAEQYYPASLGYEKSIGGVFWWYFKQEMADHDTPLRSVVVNLTNGIKTH
jgi:hypothetical protein